MPEWDLATKETSPIGRTRVRIRAAAQASSDDSPAAACAMEYVSYSIRLRSKRVATAWRSWEQCASLARWKAAACLFGN